MNLCWEGVDWTNLAHYKQKYNIRPLRAQYCFCGGRKPHFIDWKMFYY